MPECIERMTPGGVAWMEEYFAKRSGKMQHRERMEGVERLGPFGALSALSPVVYEVMRQTVAELASGKSEFLGEMLGALMYSDIPENILSATERVVAQHWLYSLAYKNQEERGRTKLADWGPQCARDEYWLACHLALMAQQEAALSAEEYKVLGQLDGLTQRVSLPLMVGQTQAPCEEGGRVLLEYVLERLTSNNLCYQMMEYFPSRASGGIFLGALFEVCGVEHGIQAGANA